jgi:histidinol-phosphate aminotransferase/threonine-phosphate decarboxylase
VPPGCTDAPQVLDFSANTNPEIPEGATRIYQEVMPTARRYPADDYASYRVTAGEYVDCDAESVIPTPGGLAAIRMAIQTTVRAGESVVVPTPSFGEYAREVRLQGAEPVFHPHEDLLGVDPADHAMVIACNPNNPTGDAYDPEAIRGFADRCRAAGTTLLVDEAFLGFTNEPSLAGEEGVIVARSLTKLFGLPGLRAGFAVATGERRDRLAAARRTWTLGGPAAAVGVHCMRRRAFVRETRARVASEPDSAYAMAFWAAQISFNALWTPVFFELPEPIVCTLPGHPDNLSDLTRSSRLVFTNGCNVLVV